MLSIVCIVCFADPTGKQCEQTGQCDGTPIDSTGATDIFSCLRDCQQKEGCAWVSFSKSLEICLLYGADCTISESSIPEITSSQLECIPQCTVQDGKCDVSILELSVARQKNSKRHFFGSIENSFLEVTHIGLEPHQFFSF